VEPRVLIVGAGGFGMAVADALISRGQCSVAGFVDDRGPEVGLVLGLPVLGRTADLSHLRSRHKLVVVALGDNERRRAIALQVVAMGFDLYTVIHSGALVSAHARVGAGALIMAGAIVGTGAEVGSGAIVNAGAVVDHHAVVGEFSHLGVGACMAGGARLGPGAHLREGGMLRAGQAVFVDSADAQGGA